MVSGTYLPVQVGKIQGAFYNFLQIYKSFLAPGLNKIGHEPELTQDKN